MFRREGRGLRINFLFIGVKQLDSYTMNQSTICVVYLTMDIPFLFLLTSLEFMCGVDAIRINNFMLITKLAMCRGIIEIPWN